VIKKKNYIKNLDDGDVCGYARRIVSVRRGVPMDVTKTGTRWRSEEPPIGGVYQNSTNKLNNPCNIRYKMNTTVLKYRRFK